MYNLPSYDPTQVLNYFTKAVDTSYAGPIPTSLLARLVEKNSKLGELAIVI